MFLLDCESTGIVFSETWDEIAQQGLIFPTTTY